MEFEDSDKKTKEKRLEKNNAGSISLHLKS
jgi:hypothetical protein